MNHFLGCTSKEVLLDVPVLAPAAFLCRNGTDTTGVTGWIPCWADAALRHTRCLWSMMAWLISLCDVLYPKGFIYPVWVWFTEHVQETSGKCLCFAMDASQPHDSICHPSIGGKLPHFPKTMSTLSAPMCLVVAPILVGGQPILPYLLTTQISNSIVT